MASSSSSTLMASSFDDEASLYDVFLSFCGQDTRNSFADHLYQGLKRAGIPTFRDNEGINKGEQLKPEIERAIKDSRASVVILSKNYATSTWCLDELLLILEQRRDCNHFVLPVFYGVEPTDVRNQKGPFSIKVKRSSKWTAENVIKWKAALREIADLAGHVLSGLETNCLKDVVDTIHNKSDDKDVALPLNITGMDTRYEVIKPWLHQPNLEFLAIYGMGGSGKTTLAKYIYRTNRKEFEYVSFLEDIGHTCERLNGLLSVQKQLLTDISGGEWREIPGVSRGQSMIGKHLRMNRVLIVLDGIVTYSQLVDLLGTGRINEHSKIVITTRENPDKWFCLSRWRCQIYEIRLLNDNESLELLSAHAFGSKIPMLGYEELTAQAIQYCEGNPLALKVLGSSMFKNSTIQNCKSQLNLLEKHIDSRIHDVLVRSYMSLPSDAVKELFLHIACFFIGKDMDYVVKILEPDYSAISGVETLVNTCLLSVSPNKTLMMHRLHQEMGKNVVFQESTKFPAKRSRVWLSSDSYNILSLGEGSKKVEGLAIDMKMLQNEPLPFTASELTTDALKNMDSLKLLQLNFVELSGSYERFSKHLRWLCWHGFQLATIPSDLYMGTLVAIDMSYCKLEVFEPPMVLQSLQILNLKDSHNLLEIRSIFKIPHLESLILWNCYSLVNVCESIGDLICLTLLNMTGCKNLFKRTNLSTSGGVDTKQPTFSFPHSLHQLFLKDCHVTRTDSFPLSFSVQPNLQYLNLGNSLFESLPCYSNIESLRVLDLSFCTRLKCLICLPSTLAELYISYCELLERITFQSPHFKLQEFCYEGCIHLYEIEGFFKLVPVANLDEADLGHLKWLKEYQKYEVCLVGDDETTVGRSWHIQMLYEFGIISTSLPDIKNPNMTYEYISKSSTLSFDVPSSPRKRLEGINVIIKYEITGKDCAWFCKISTANGDVDLMYNPKVFGKLESGEVCIWLSYWPIGNKLNTGDTVNISITVLSGLEVHECGVSLLYSDQETMKSNMGWEEIVGGDLSKFQLSTGAYYLCRKDFIELAEFGRLTLDWFRLLVGDTIDYTEVRGWRKTGQPKPVNQSHSERHAKQHERRMDSATEEGERSSLSTSAHPCRIFSLTEILSATNNFAEELIIGKGGFGPVYKGQIFSEEASLVVAIKRLDSMSSQGEVEFWAEIEMLSTLRHCNLVPLIGYCLDNKEMILVYKFVSNGTLYHHLHKADTPLSWMTRLKIAIGAARGLDYLHTGVGMGHGIIHRDVKSTNILLDAKWEAMITDFGLSKFGPNNQSYSYVKTTVKGTFGYFDPDYFLTGRLTRKSDVYGFGIVLFELLSGRLAVDPRKEDAESLLVTWAKKCVEDRKLDYLVDPNIKGTISTKCLRRFSPMAARCVHDAPKKRPTMSELLGSLQALLELQLQEKSDHSTESSGLMSFPRRIYKYFVPATKPNSGQIGTSSKKNLDDKQQDD